MSFFFQLLEIHYLREAEDLDRTMARSRATRAASKASKPGREPIQKNENKATSSDATRSRPRKVRHESSTRNRMVPSASEVQVSKDYRSPVHTIHDEDQLRKNSGPYNADDGESVVPPRRFSDLYGHGRPLSPEELTTPSREGKRKRSLSTSEPSPKKVRFDPTHDETRQIQEDKVRSLPVSPIGSMAPGRLDDHGPYSEAGLEAAPALMSDPSQLLLDGLVCQPESLALPAIAALFTSLQSQAKNFGKTWFGFSKHDVKSLGGDHGKKRFPLHELEVTYPALFWTTLNILDSPVIDPKRAWLRYFTEPVHRQALVYGILGEWLSQRVFKDTSFGLSEDFKQEMTQSVDIKYLHYDSFVRAKKRAKLVEYAFNAGARDANLEALEIASRELADELLIVLAPLLPIWTESDPFGVNLSPIAATWKVTFRSDMIELIKKAAGVNFSLIRSGEDGTIIRIASRLEHGREFSPLAPMKCINSEEVNPVTKTRSGVSKHEKLMVKMTCWARVEAYVPHGMDVEEMGYQQQMLLAEENGDLIVDAKSQLLFPTKKQFEKSYEDFCWDCLDPEAFPELPSELWRQAAEQQGRLEMLARSAKLTRQLDRRSNMAGGDLDSDPDSSVDSDYEYSSSSSGSEDVSDTTADDNRPQSPPRGAWVTIFDKLTPHQVYCEWTKPLSNHDIYQCEGRKMDGDDLKELNSLRAIVRAARDCSASPSVKREDFMIRIWNFYATRNLWVEWLPILAFTIYLSRGKVVNNLTGMNDRLKNLVLARFADAHEMVDYLTPESISTIKSVWNESVITKQLCSIGTPKDLLLKILEKLREVVPMPPSIDHITDALKTEANSIAFGPAAAFGAAISSAIGAFLPGHNAPSMTIEAVNTVGPAIALTATLDQAVRLTPSVHAAWF